MMLKRAGLCNFENLLHMPNSLTSMIGPDTQTKSTKFLGMLGEDENMIRDKFGLKFSNSHRAN